MGCSDSTQIIQTKQKIIEKPQTIFSQASKQWNYFLIGCISQKQSVFCKVNLSDYSINRMSLPQNFEAHNFLSMLQFSEGQYFISGGINHSLSEITADSYIYNAKIHQVQKLKPMHQARYTHISLFFNNFIYVLGGRYYGQDKMALLSGCQKFSLTQRCWINLPQMNQKRCTGFSFIWKSQIYVMGGYTGPFQRSTKIQFLCQNQSSWKLLDFELNRGIQSAIAFSSNPNQITIFGGLTNSGATNSVVTLNFTQKSIISNKKINQMRSLHKSFYYDRKMHIFGGEERLSLQCYEIQSQNSNLIKSEINFTIQDFDNFGYSTKTITVEFENQKEHIAQQEVNKSQEIFIFGSTQEPFILKINVQNFQIKKYPVPLSIKLHNSQGAVKINQNQFILLGGCQDSYCSIVTAETNYYNHKQKKGKKLASMNQSRYSFTYQFNRERNLIWVIGGATTNQNKIIYLDICEKYNISQNKWQIISKLPKKLMDPMSLIFNKHLYVFAGGTPQKQINKSIFKYDQVKNKWITLQPDFSINLKASTVYQISQNKFYLLGGKNQKQEEKNQIWSATFKSQNQINIQSAGLLTDRMAKPGLFKPVNENFYVVFGGKQKISFYDTGKDNLILKSINDGKLSKLKDSFCQRIVHLNENLLQKYLIVP